MVSIPATSVSTILETLEQSLSSLRRSAVISVIAHVRSVGVRRADCTGSACSDAAGDPGPRLPADQWNRF